MKLGMIYNNPDAAGFAYLQSKGLSFAEICCNYDEDNRRIIDMAEKIRENVENTGITVQSVGRWNAFPNAGGQIDETVFARNLELMEAAHSFGAKVFVTGCNYDDTISLYKNYTAAIAYFGRMLEEAEKRSMTLAVYNCDWNNFVHSPEQWRVVLGELPSLMLKYDASHAYSRGSDYLSELNEWLPRIAHMHIKGVCRLHGAYVDDPPAGMDDLPWRTIFALLYKHQYAGGLSIEPHSSTWFGALAEPGVDFTIRYIRQFLLS